MVWPGERPPLGRCDGIYFWRNHERVHWYRSELKVCPKAYSVQVNGFAKYAN